MIARSSEMRSGGSTIYLPSPNTTSHRETSKLEDLTLVIPYWLDQSRFPGIKHLAAEPLRHFQPPVWLLWNIMTREVIQKVMKDIILSAWNLMFLSASGVI